MTKYLVKVRETGKIASIHSNLKEAEQSLRFSVYLPEQLEIIKECQECFGRGDYYVESRDAFGNVHEYHHTCEYCSEKESI
jgi:aspartate carbamoyltransferase regulatory subunit